MGRGKSKAGGGKIVQFTRKPKSMVDNENGWDYRGNSEYIGKLENDLNSAKSANRIQAIALSARKMDKQITTEIERLHNNTADVKGSENALLTQRRRVRAILRKAKI